MNRQLFDTSHIPDIILCVANALMNKTKSHPSKSFCSSRGYFCLIAKWYLTLCNPTDCSPPGSSVHGIFQARKLEALPFPSPGDFPHPGVEPVSPALQEDSLPLSRQGSRVLD